METRSQDTFWTPSHGHLASQACEGTPSQQQLRCCTEARHCRKRQLTDEQPTRKRAAYSPPSTPSQHSSCQATFRRNSSMTLQPDSLQQPQHHCGDTARTAASEPQGDSDATSCAHEPALPQQAPPLLRLSGTAADVPSPLWAPGQEQQGGYDEGLQGDGQLKQCQHCAAITPACNFYHSLASPDGLQSCCKACQILRLSQLLSPPTERLLETEDEDLAGEVTSGLQVDQAAINQLLGCMTPCGLQVVQAAAPVPAAKQPWPEDGGLLPPPPDTDDEFASDIASLMETVTQMFGDC